MRKMNTAFTICDTEIIILLISYFTLLYIFLKGTIPFKRRIKFTLGKNGRLPKRGSTYAAGFDLYTPISFILEAGDRKPVPIDVCVQVPSGYYARIAPRSGLAYKYGIDILAGVVDSDYRGEIIVIIQNHGQAKVEFTAGDRIAQLIPEKIGDVLYATHVTFLDASSRDVQGFGSSGK